MLIFGLFNTNVGKTNINVDILSNKSTSPIASEYKNIFTKIKGVSLINDNNVSSARNKVKNGKIDLLIMFTSKNVKPVCTGKEMCPLVGSTNRSMIALPIPHYFIHSVNVTFYSNKNDQTYPYIRLLIANIKNQVLSKELGSHSPITFSEKNISGQGLSYIIFLTPGIVALAIMQGVLFAVVTILISYRDLEILRRISVTPFKKSDFIVSLSITRLAFAIIQAAILIAVAKLVYNISPIGSFVDLALVIIVGALMFIMLALIISSVANKVETAMPITNVITLPMMFLSGLFFPISTLPSWLSDISKYFPLTYLINAIRGIYVNGYNLPHLGGDFLGMGIWIVIFFIVNIFVFKWE
ncbi:ABC transporter permease [Patescibacteria group bacterium]|nr:ABC transporter permease [Patescibacteria group bacterium]